MWPGDLSDGHTEPLAPGWAMEAHPQGGGKSRAIRLGPGGWLAPAIRQVPTLPRPARAGALTALHALRVHRTDKPPSSPLLLARGV